MEHTISGIINNMKEEILQLNYDIYLKRSNAIKAKRLCKNEKKELTKLLKLKREKSREIKKLRRKENRFALINKINHFFSGSIA